MRAYSLNSPTIMIRLIRLATVDNSTARLAPPHFMKPFFVRHARRPSQASSVAMMINIAKASNSNIEYPVLLASSRPRLRKDRSQSSEGAQTGDAHGDLKVERCDVVSTPGFLRYSCNVTAVTMSES